MASSGGYPCEWFLQMSDDLVYILCLGILNDPQQCKNGHLFCKHCILKSVLTLKKCPTCKLKLYVKDLSSCLLAKTMIENLQVRCHRLPILSPGSCSWTGPMFKHLYHVCLVTKAPSFGQCF